MSVITLLTDFGLKDPYAGIMKGVILSIHPDARIIDISHEIDAQDLLGAAHVFASAFPYFPENSIHTVVVDPGVGSGRKIIAALISGRICLSPDNGVLSLLDKSFSMDKAVYVENSDFFLPNVSSTFHGRDIFAPVAARLSMGLPMEKLGPVADPDQLVKLDPPLALAGEKKICGSVVRVDRFGNLITNIREEMLNRFCPLEDRNQLTVRAKGILIKGLSSCYADVPGGAFLALAGSGGQLEISVNKGSAARISGLAAGEKVWIEKR